jgi:parallel beta-helix repeat protein
MSSYNSTIRNNNFQNNQVAFHMFEGGYNQIYNNNFIGNIKQAEEQHSDPSRWPLDGYYTSTNNSWYQAPPVGGNYWSDYKGSDGNGDGFGDTPYLVVEDYYDQYPIMHAANTVQPTSEDLSPSEVTQTSTGIVNSIETPQPVKTNDQPMNNETSGEVLSVSQQPLQWELVILAIVIVSIIVVGVVSFSKTRSTLSKHPTKTIIVK